MASSVNLSERLQILENLLETFTREFQQLKKELDAAQKTSAQSATVKEPEMRPSPKREFAADKDATVISESFFSEESLEMGHQSQPKRGFAVDKDATVISGDFFSEESLEMGDRSQSRRNFAVDREATVISEDFFSEESLEMGHQQQASRRFASDKEATMISENPFAEESLIYEEFNASGEWEDLQKELDPGKATIAFDFPVADKPAPKPAAAMQPPQSMTKPTAKPVEPPKPPSNKQMPDPWT